MGIYNVKEYWKETLKELCRDLLIVSIGSLVVIAIIVCATAIIIKYNLLEKIL